MFLEIVSSNPLRLLKLQMVLSSGLETVCSQFRGYRAKI